MRFSLVVVCSAALIPACSKEPTGTSNEPPAVQMLVVSPSPAFVAAGESVQLTVSALNADSQLVIGIPVTFSSSDRQVLTVSNTGVVHSEGPVSSALITVSSGAVKAFVPAFVFGVVARTTGLTGRPYAAAISHGGVSYVGLLDEGKLARANLPNTAFTPAVTVGNVPAEIAFNASGSRAYVTNQASRTVSVVDVASNTATDQVPVTGAPFEVTVPPGDSILVVTTNADSVYLIRLATKSVVARFPTPNTANGLAVSDTMLYVSTWQGGVVMEINLRTRVVSRTFAVGGIPQKLALSPDDKRLYIANQAGYLQFWDLVAGTQIGTNLSLPGGGGYGIDRSPETGLLYVSTAYYGGGNLHVVDPATRQLLKTFPLGGSTRRVVFHSSGLGLVPNEGGWVDFIR